MVNICSNGIPSGHQTNMASLVRKLWRHTHSVVRSIWRVSQQPDQRSGLFQMMDLSWFQMFRFKCCFLILGIDGIWRIPPMYFQFSPIQSSSFSWNPMKHLLNSIKSHKKIPSNPIKPSYWIASNPIKPSFDPIESHDIFMPASGIILPATWRIWQFVIRTKFPEGNSME